MTMNDSNNKGTTGAGLGFTAVLALIFITLKLLGKITWSWVWVLSPIWIPFVLVVLVILVIVIKAGR